MFLLILGNLCNGFGFAHHDVCGRRCGAFRMEAETKSPRQLLPEMLMASRRGLHRTTNHRDLALDPPDHIHPGPHGNVSSILLSISRA